MTDHHHQHADWAIFRTQRFGLSAGDACATCSCACSLPRSLGLPFLRAIAAVLLIGAALPAFAQDLSFNPASLDFDPVEAGSTSSPQTAVLHNAGDADITGLSIEAPANYVVDSNDCGGSLVAGGNCDVLVTFAPTTPGSFAGTLTVNSDQSHSVDLDLSGCSLSSEAMTAQYDTVLVSRACGIDGPKGNASSEGGRISADGRFIVFTSESTNIHPDANSGTAQVFVRDLRTDETIVISRAEGEAGSVGNGDSNRDAPSISADGQYVAFTSSATNLHPDDVDDGMDIYVRDVQSGEMQLVSRATGFDGAAGNSGSYNPSISGDGKIVFYSEATNLHPDDADSGFDVYVRDTETHETALVSRATGVNGDKGNATSWVIGGPHISTNGRYVAFLSLATNLHPDDQDSEFDVYVRDLEEGSTTLASRASGSEGNTGNERSYGASLSGNGRRVAFYSLATNLHPDADVVGQNDVYMRDLDSSQTMLISKTSGPDGLQGNNHSGASAISADGDVITFNSAATNLHPDDADSGQDVFARHLPTDTVLLISRASGLEGDKANGFSANASVSADGRLVVFNSEATSLNPDDSDDMMDVYVRDVLGPAGQADLTFSPTNLDFGDVEIGATSQPQTATLHNGDMEATGVTFDVPGNDFDADTSDCGPTLDPQESCEVVITFTPADFGSAEAGVTVSSDQGASDTLDLTGNGMGTAGAELAFDPSSFDFGDVEVGETSPPQAATLQNSGTGAASGLTFTTTLPNAFTADASPCGAVLDAGESCTVEVTFTPLAGGELTAALQVDSTEGVSAALGLTGIGVVPPAPDLAFTPESLDFGEVPVGTASALRNATLENTGDGDATSMSFTTPGTGFDADTSDCGSTLPAGASCSVSVTFTPGAPGGNAATLEVESAKGATATLGNQPPPDNYLYFFSGTMKSVFRMDPNDLHSGRSLFTADYGYNGADLLGFAVDTQHCAYYYIPQNPELGGSETRVRRANLDGTGEEIVDAIPTRIRGLEVDMASQTLYYSRSATSLNAGIHRAVLGPDGISDAELVVDTSDQPSISSLALDTEADRVYWSAATIPSGDSGGIWRARLDGSEIEQLVDTSGEPRPTGLALDLQAGKIYWGDEESTTEGAGDIRIHRANLDGTGYEVFLVVEESVDHRGLLRDVMVDSDQGKVYWAISHGEGLYRANTDGTNIQRISQFDDHHVYELTSVPGDIDAQCGPPAADICPEGAACDRVDAIYWGGGTSSGGELWRSRPDGTYQEMFFESGPYKSPRSVTVSRKVGKVYWTNEGFQDEVIRANLDGTDRETLVQMPSASGESIGNLGLDHASGKMYFSHQISLTEERIIWQANLDGTDLRQRFHFDTVYVRGPSIDEEARVGYVGHEDSLYRFDLDADTPLELVASDLPPQDLWPEGMEPNSSGVSCSLPDLGPEEAKRCYWRQGFSCGPRCATARTYRMDLNGTNVELLPWTEPKRLTRAADGYSGRMYGTGVARNHMSRWQIDDGEDLSLIHDLPAEIGSISTMALLPATSGGTWATLSLTGIGVAPELTVDPGSVDFGAVHVGGSGDVQTVTLTSSGNASLNITSITTASSPFGRVGGNCPGAPFDLAPGSTCTIDYIFQPTDEGVFEQTITVESSAGADNFTLTGEGIPAPPVIVVAPSSIQANLATDQSTEEALAITNDGASSLDWAVTEDDCMLPDWAGVDPVDGSVAGGEAQPVAITLDAAGLDPDDYSAELCLASNDPELPEVVIPLLLSVTDQPGVLTVDPVSLDYGEVMEGFAAEQDFTVTNTAEAGAAPLELATLEIDYGAVAFAVSGGDCTVGTGLEPGASCTAQVTFTPDGESAFIGQISVGTQDGQTVAVSLTGAGIPTPDEAFRSRFEDGVE